MTKAQIRKELRRTGGVLSSFWASDELERAKTLTAMFAEGELIEADRGPAKIHVVINQTFTIWQRSIHTRGHLVRPGGEGMQVALCGARGMEWLPGRYGKPECPKCKKIAIEQSK